MYASKFLTRIRHSQPPRRRAENFPQTRGNFLNFVRPCRIELRTFSCFDNFVPSNNCGVPEHTPTHYALHHLEQLLKCISDRVRTKKQKNAEESVLEDGEILGVRTDLKMFRP